MGDFKTVFLGLCKENYMDPQQSVLNRIQALYKSDENKTVLDLSGETLTIGTCAVLGKALAHDLNFTTLILADCMLNEEGAKVLLQGLENNTVIQTLDLKGNNLQQKAAKAIGSFLKNNHSLKSLSLEWNCLGVWEATFGELCDGLAGNCGLTSIDLRNNQINTKCAQELALALKINKSLQSVDLRWNNIGLVGGRSLSESISENKTLCKCEISGNNLPLDLMNSIHKCVEYNEDRLKLSTNSHKQAQTLALEIDMLKDEKNRQMVGFIDQLESAQHHLDQTYEASSKKVQHLERALSERKAALNALRAKLDMSEASLAMAYQKLKDQEVLIDLERKENSEMSKRHQSQIQKERDERKKTEQKFQEELRDVSEKHFQSQGEIMEFERKCKMQHDEILLLKENIAQHKAEHRLAVSNAEERLDNETRRHQNTLLEQQKLHEQVQQAMKKEAQIAEDSWQERIKGLEQTKIDLEKDLRIAQANILVERNQFDEKLKELRQQMKRDEQTSVEQVQDRLQAVQSEKSLIQNQNAQLSAEITDLQAKKSALNIELDGARRTLHTMTQQLSTKETEIATEVERVRTEMNRRIVQLEKECEQHASLREKIVNLEESLVREATRNREDSDTKSREISRLQVELQASKALVEKIREDEARRASILQQAVMNYVQGSPVKINSGM